MSGSQWPSIFLHPLLQPIPESSQHLQRLKACMKSKDEDCHRIANTGLHCNVNQVTTTSFFLWDKIGRDLPQSVTRQYLVLNRQFWL